MFHNVPDPSVTATVQNVSEISDTTINNPQSLSITIDSNILQIPLLHNKTQNTIIDENQNVTNNITNQDNTSILSTSDTHISQPFQTQHPSPR